MLLASIHLTDDLIQKRFLQVFIKLKNKNYAYEFAMKISGAIHAEMIP